VPSEHLLLRRDLHNLSGQPAQLSDHFGDLQGAVGFHHVQHFDQLALEGGDALALGERGEVGGDQALGVGDLFRRG
jgi:hypothetical protein